MLYAFNVMSGSGLSFEVSWSHMPVSWAKFLCYGASKWFICFWIWLNHFSFWLICFVQCLCPCPRPDIYQTGVTRVAWRSQIDAHRFFRGLNDYWQNMPEVTDRTQVKTIKIIQSPSTIIRAVDIYYCNREISMFDHVMGLSVNQRIVWPGNLYTRYNKIFKIRKAHELGLFLRPPGWNSSSWHYVAPAQGVCNLLLSSIHNWDELRQTGAYLITANCAYCL